MSDSNPGDYVDTGMEPPPRLPPVEYRPQGGEALERLYMSYTRRCEEWSGYAAARSREISAQYERIAQRRQSSTRYR